MKKRWWILGFVVLLAIPLVWLLKDWVREVVLAEILTTAWIVGLRISTLPQAPIWILFVLIVIYLALRTLFPRTPLPPEPLPPLPPHVGELRSLAKRIERSAEGDYFRWDLARHVGGVMIDSLAYRRRTSRAEIRQQLRAGQLDVPPVIHRFLLVGMAPIYTLSSGLVTRFRHLFAAEAAVPTLDQDMEQIVQYLEDLLEVSHDS